MNARRCSSSGARIPTMTGMRSGATAYDDDHRQYALTVRCDRWETSGAQSIETSTHRDSGVGATVAGTAMTSALAQSTASHHTGLQQPVRPAITPAPRWTALRGGRPGPDAAAESDQAAHDWAHPRESRQQRRCPKERRYDQSQRCWPAELAMFMVRPTCGRLDRGGRQGTQLRLQTLQASGQLCMPRQQLVVAQGRHCILNDASLGSPALQRSVNGDELTL